MALDKFKVNYELIETKENHGPWLKGRGAEIIVSGTKLERLEKLTTYFKNFELSVPIHGAELFLDKLRELVQDPVH